MKMKNNNEMKKWNVNNEMHEENNGENKKMIINGRRENEMRK